MTRSQPPRRNYRTRIRRGRVAGTVAAVVAIVAVPGYLEPRASPLPSASSPVTLLPELPGQRSEHRPLRREQRGALGEADGALPDDATVFEDALPGVANLDPALLDALRRAAADASSEGVELFVISGWRSPEYQARLLREAVSKHGSEEQAARWVAAPDTSLHVSGDAVDIGRSEATAWLSLHGARYGLCQIYGNEPWHYELRADAAAHGCPPMYPDPTHDPRMEQ